MTLKPRWMLHRTATFSSKFNLRINSNPSNNSQVIRTRHSRFRSSSQLSHATAVNRSASNYTANASPTTSFVGRPAPAPAVRTVSNLTRRDYRPSSLSWCVTHMPLDRAKLFSSSLMTSRCSIKRVVFQWPCQLLTSNPRTVPSVRVAAKMRIM